LRCFRTTTRGVRNSCELIDLSGHLLRILFDFGYSSFSRGGPLFEWDCTRFDGTGSAKVSLIEANLFRLQFAVRSAAAFNFKVQPAQNIGLAIVRAAAQEAAVALNGGPVG
jgi:hypothetical protein